MGMVTLMPSSTAAELVADMASLFGNVGLLRFAFAFSLEATDAAKGS